jgi:DNA polymerase-3 subunit gamma/tau
VRRHWDEILGLVRRRKQRAAALLGEATVREVDGNTILLLFKHSFHANSVASEPQYLLDAVHEVLGDTWQLRCEVNGQVAGPTESSAPSPPRQAATPTQTAPAKSTTQRPPTPQRAGSAGDADDSWPTPARPGGGQVSTPAAPTTDAPTPAAKEQATSAPRPRGGTRARPSAEPGKSNKSNKSNKGARTAGSSDEEPPYDPDYDAPVRDPRAYEGFDPGDEPLDDVDEQAARQTSEQQALQLLQQALGAEKIGEVDRRQP